MGGGGRGGHQISRTPLMDSEFPIGKAKGHQGLHTCFWVLGTGDRSGPDPPQSEACPERGQGADAIPPLFPEPPERDRGGGTRL